MLFKIDWTENKNNNWKIVSLTDISGAQFENVSINRVNNRGETFPNFDTIKPGEQIEADLWTSDSGKKYLFAPKNLKKGGNTNIQAAQQRKAADIEKAQDNKEIGIKTSSTIRMAVDIAIAQDNPSPENITKIRQWLWSNWEVDIKEQPPF